jgi:hypothetical protein
MSYQRNIRRSLLAFVVGVCAASASSANAADIDFEGLAEGQVIVSVSNGEGATGLPNGFVTVRGFNPRLGVNVNAAVVFDSDCPHTPPVRCSGSDGHNAGKDLGTPNEDFGGPGIGDGGGLLAPVQFQNETPLHKTAIIEKYMTDANNDGLIDDPNDVDARGAFIELDFSTLKGRGTVTVNAVTYMDVDLEEGESGATVFLFGPKIPPSSFTLQPTGDNGVFTVSNVGVEGVSLMRILLNGSGSVASVTVDQPPVRPCWVTTGGFFNAGVTSGAKQCTFGGNIGPPPSGAFEVNFHSGPNAGAKFHTNDIEALRCEDSGSTGPQQPGGKKGLEVDTLFFDCTGRLNNVTGYTCEGYLLDGGEPQGKQGNDNDHIQFIVKDGAGATVATCEGDLDGGNVQIHPPVGNQ